MKLLFHPCVSHNEGGPIYSLDYHPSGKKLVTCGQRGSKDSTGVITIWDVSESAPAILCDLYLSKIANCVRWSKHDNGKHFACADEQEVTVYHYVGRVRSAGTYGFKSRQNEEERETYKVLHHLHGHHMDILNVEWSHDGRFLASSSVDGSIIIWDAANLPMKVIELNADRGGHKEAVKGICFDPVGKLFTSQSADKLLKIWNTDDWKCTESVAKPFREGNSSMFLRHDWSPDGTYLVAPGASNNGGPTAQIICRNGWTTRRDFVGHHKTVTCIKACPTLLRFTDHKGNTRNVSCFAVGSSDKTLSVWCIPAVRRPVLVLTNLFQHSIVDLSWSGYKLAASSIDGTVRFLDFKLEELGALLTRAEMCTEFHRIYKMVPTQYDAAREVKLNVQTTSRNTFGILGDARFLEVERLEKRNRAQMINVINAQKEAAVAAAQKPVVPEGPQVQTEFRTKKGKRKIKPVFLGSIGAEDPISQSSEAEESTTVATELSISAEGIMSPAVSYPKPKRRSIEVNAEPAANLERVEEAQPEECIVDPIKNRSRTTEIALPQLPQMPTLSEHPALRPRQRSVSRNAAFSLSIPFQKQQFVVRVEPTSATDPVCSIHIDNNMKLSEQSSKVVVARITALSEQNAHVWSVLVDGIVALTEVNPRFFVLSTFDGSVMILSRSTGRIIQHFVIGSVAIRIVLNSDNLLILTSLGMVFVWDLNKMQCLLRESATDILADGASIRHLQLTDSGIPVFHCYNGKMRSFDEKLMCWSLSCQ